jgi:hypothetical protein
VIIEYNTTTKEIATVHPGKKYVASEWTSYSRSGHAIAKSDTELDTHNKYAIIDGDGITFTLGNLNFFSISQAKTYIEANDTDYCDFTGVPEGTTIAIDGVDRGTMDASGTLRFKATEVGLYYVTFTKLTWRQMGMSVRAGDGYLYDNITGE